MKSSLHAPFVAASLLLAAAVFAPGTAAQAPQGLRGDAGSPTPATPSHTYPAPTNLKVLPKDLTGQQVHDIMKQWSASLGSRCDSCHAEDPEKINPDGQPILRFADDSRPMKAVARTMYTMTEAINSNYIARLQGSGLPVTCGTCHRGHIGPEPFDASSQSQKPPMSAPADQNRPASQ